MLTQQQEILYQLLLEVVDICNKHNISYGIGNDTLLDAISVKSLLPESNTISVFMTNQNYRKFCDICKNKDNLSTYSFLDCRATNNLRTYSFAKFVNTKTTLFTKDNILSGNKSGIGVDIYCLDSIRNNHNDLNRYYKKLRLYCDFLNNSKNYSLQYEDNRFSYITKKLKSKVSSKEALLTTFEKGFEKYNEENCDFYIVRQPNIPICIPKEIVGDFNSLVTIAGKKVRTFSDPYYYLSILYGEEWMHHNNSVTYDETLILNKKTEFDNINNELKLFLDSEKINKALEKEKTIGFLTSKKVTKTNDFRSKIELIGKSLEDHNYLCGKNDDIVKYSEEENYMELSKIFKEYIKNQSSLKLIGSYNLDNIYRYHHPLLIKIDTEYYEAVVLTLFHTNRIDKAKRFIEVYSHHFEKTIIMKVIEENIVQYRKALSYVAENNFQNARAILDKLLSKFPKNVSFIKLKLHCIVKSFFTDNCEKEICQLLQTGLEVCPDDGDLLKYQSELLLSSDFHKGIDGYIKAYPKTNNIITKRDIRDTIDRNLNTIIKDKDIDFLDKLLDILNDDFRLYNRKFELMNKDIENTDGRERKAKKQFDFILYLVNLRYKYKEKFSQNIFSKTEKTISQWYHKIVENITDSEFIACVSAEIINCTDFNKLSMILDNIDNYMNKLNIEDIKYLYCLILKSHILKNMGENQKASKILIQCAKENKDPYLAIVIKNDFQREINCIYNELTNTGEHIYDSSITGKVSAKKIKVKETKDKKYVYGFYENRVKKLYPSVLNFLKSITKAGLITVQEKNNLIEKLSIKESSSFDKEIATALYNLTNKN